MTRAAASSEVLDCVCFDPLQAYYIASLRQRVQVTAALTGTQMCYYVGEQLIPEAPENLVAIRPTELVEFLVRTRYRWPTQVLFPPSMQTAEAILPRAQQMMALLEEAKQRRRQIASHIATRYARRAAEPPTSPLRVMAVTTRYTTVVQYTARSLIDAFSEFGTQTQFVIEGSDKEELNDIDIATTLERFDPHIVLNVNFSNNHFFPDDVYNVIWIQDPLDAFLPEGSLLAWRRNDLAYTAVGEYIAEITATGIPRTRVAIQPFCIDRKTFVLDENEATRPRKDKVVFIGNAANFASGRSPQEQALTQELTTRLARGDAISNQEVAALGARYGFSRYQSIFQISYMVMRDHIVRWLCQIPGIAVEVYGRFWENDPVVAPFHRGVLPHGRAVAEVYRTAKYALVLHPFSVSTQRLAEAAACGCIPIVYDCRFQADEPHWEEFVLYFRTAEELGACVRGERPTDPKRFGEYFDYRHFVRRIVSDAGLEQLLLPLLPL